MVGFFGPVGVPSMGELQWVTLVVSNVLFGTY